jgi:hypothetical protein
MKTAVTPDGPVNNLALIATSLDKVANAINRVADGLVTPAPKEPMAVRLAVVGLYIYPKSRKKGKMINTSCRSNEKVRISLAPLGPDGEPEKLDGAASGSVTSGSGTVEQVDDLTVDILPADGFEGTLIVDITGDAAEGPAVKVLTETVTVTVFHPDAVTLGATSQVLPKRLPAPAP